MDVSLCMIEAGLGMFIYYKQMTAYEMRISDCSSDVCSSDLVCREARRIDIVDVDEEFRVAADRRPILAADRKLEFRCQTRTLADIGPRQRLGVEIADAREQRQPVNRPCLEIGRANV